MYVYLHVSEPTTFNLLMKIIFHSRTSVFSFFYAVEYETYRYSKDIHGSDDILKVGFFSSVWYNTCITLEKLMLQG